MNRVDASTASIRIGPVVVQCEGDARALDWLWPQHSAFSTSQHPDITVRLALSETPLMGPSMPTAQRSDNVFELAYHGWRARLTGDYADAWNAAGHAVQNIDMPAHNHFDIALSLTEPQGVLVGAVRASIASHAAGEAA